MRTVYSIFFHGNFFIAICAAALYSGGLVRQEKIPQVLDVLFVFASVFCIYNVQRLFLIPKDPLPEIARHRYYLHFRATAISFTIIAGAYMLYWIAFRILSIDLSMDQLGMIVLTGIISLFYFLPEIGLRRIGLLKPFLIGITWALFMNLSWGFSDTEREAWYVAERFCFISSLALLFDWRDREGDAARGTDTYAVRWGLGITRGLSAVFFLAALLIAALVFKQGYYYLLTLPLMVLILWMLPSRKSEGFYVVLVDGVILAQGITEFFLDQNSMR